MSEGKGFTSPPLQGCNLTRKGSENGQDIRRRAMLYTIPLCKRASGALGLGDGSEEMTREGVDPPQLGSRISSPPIRPDTISQAVGNPLEPVGASDLVLPGGGVIMDVHRTATGCVACL